MSGTGLDTLAERLDTLAGELAEAVAGAAADHHRLERIRRLHSLDREGYCVEDGWRWPCRTIRTVDNRPSA